MACGAKYMELVRTSSGYTPSNLWKEKVFGLIDIPSIDDFNEWEALATRLRDEAYRRLYELGAIEESRSHKLPGGSTIYPRYEAMRAIYEPLNVRVNELREAFSIGNLFSDDTVHVTVTGRLGELSQVSVDLACLIEQIDTEIAKYGVPPRPLHTAAADTEKELGVVGGILLIGGAIAIVGGTFIIARKIAS